MSPQREDPAPEDDPAWLSAAVDGDKPALERTARAWRDSASTRRTWHTYQLIGDTLRSSELAAPAARDAVFLEGIRARLATEPVLLAPAPSAVRPHARWAVPAAVAAGFVVVAGVLVLSRLGSPGGSGWKGDTLAAASSPGGAVAAAQEVAPPLRLVAQEGLVRDVRLDEFLRAHKAAGGGMAVPGSALRRVDIVVPAEAPR
jgi:sigma-E factor negative regulatory protein RseA